jgi:hypothetical protein
LYQANKLNSLKRFDSQKYAAIITIKNKIIGY